MIAFRDFLRTHALIRNEYGELKKQLSKRESSDMNEYNDEKNSYVKQLEKKQHPMSSQMYRRWSKRLQIANSFVLL